jgi:hypothetical protein
MSLKSSIHETGQKTVSSIVSLTEQMGLFMAQQAQISLLNRRQSR